MSTQSTAQEYWLISAPSDRTKEETYQKLAEVTISADLTTNYKFNVPDLKVSQYTFNVHCLTLCLITVLKILKIYTYLRAKR